MSAKSTIPKWERVRMQNQRYYAIHRERICAEQKAWRKANPEASAALNTGNTRRWRAANPEKNRRASLAWYHKNPEKTKASRKKWQAANLEAYKEMQRKANRRRHHRDRDFKTNRYFASVIRANIRTALQNFEAAQAKKSANSETLIGCTIAELRVHIQSLFKPGMAWNNQGKNGWHIDHIKPCCSFDLTKPDDQRKCFHFTNLQPLWWHENAAKSLQDKEQAL